MPVEAIETESLKLEQEQQRYEARSDQPEYLASQDSANSFEREFSRGNLGFMYKLAGPPPPPVPLKLQPGVVEREASVTITYAIEP